MKKILNYTLLLALIVNISSGCSDDYLDTMPTNAVNAATAFGSIENITMIVNGLALTMDTHETTYRQGLGGESGIKIWYGNFTGNSFCSSSNASAYGAGNTLASGDYHDNANSDYVSFPWFYYYRLVAGANSVLPYIDTESGTDAEKHEKQWLKAQALTFRAHAFTMLIQLYGYRWTDSNNGATDGIILHLVPTVDPKPLSTMAETYDQIYTDLDEAINLYKASGWERPSNPQSIGAPNINVAYAIYARAAINKLDYAKAIKAHL
ncbi:MAG: hypothetical protein EZS26_003756 [Candidatus Ordinivivax streblomastigis]|uniref:SusD-like N-terminal domain-containing protein n=1 Tax=Candidatus Ordinivivax streblomastigis TaxID=2540710 RepID=A0A5M8NY01_9BACT|nr:MAG: hypothetical protein EZS26_003756 [Candidatus Ordinivivax streblomastigis]